VDTRKLLAGTAIATTERRYTTLLTAVAALALLSPLASQPARADALSPIIGNYSGHFNDMEDFFDPTSGTIVNTGFGAIGQQNFGIDVLGSISSSSGGVYGGPGFGDYLIGVFGGITVGQVVNNSDGSNATGFGPGTTGFASGGQFHIYEIPQADFASTAAFNLFVNSTSAAGFTGAGCGGQTVAQVAAGTGFCYSGLTTLPAVSDVLDFALQPSYSSFTTGGGATIPLNSTYTLGASFNSTLTGVSSTWGDVNGGTDAAQFSNRGEINPIGVNTDISLIDDFCQEAPGCGSLYSGTPNPGWTVASSDPFNGTAVVPEPSTLLLLGSQLLGLGVFAGWRRKRNGG
jgi:hypothetical protein